MADSRRKPKRTCLGCRQEADQDDLVRYVVAPGGSVLVDYRRRLPGRGAYTHIDRTCVLTAVKKRQFDRSFHGENQKLAEEDLLASLAEGIRERILNLLGIARKSGQAVSGSNLVLESLGSGGLVFILLAEDISSSIEEKILGRAGRAGIPCLRLFEKGLLGQVLGKGERSVVALKTGPLAETMKKELFRYKHIVGES